ncbi:MAG: hypothetical protein DWQ44_05710 [Bacteroidetes bacterium]|nr:MAG: hypothetical protein DWQ33_01295 [Bacteroidota bacterium]REK03518.1 MAG: hypothetical protein DWQ39_09985 [Bacteroidota bacterium]REK34823.1 MAG: hypothetical protein DWQ44_05710 [Bacteroidota bacterium]REK51297.1 MAG: hypothetical protein DWQ48_01440 [Bacteroidota bacterium]
MTLMQCRYGNSQDPCGMNLRQGRYGNQHDPCGMHQIDFMKALLQESLKVSNINRININSNFV